LGDLFLKFHKIIGRIFFVPELSIP
jgi:hypothetical protein